MGEGVWLFLHILDVASWDDGIAHDWKDEAAAEDMGMPVRTLREHRRKLSELGYITCLQKQYTQDIVIHNWTNPREYTGQTYNKKQGDSETEPEEKTQGYTQGYTQGSRKDVTPTLDSNNKESIGDLELQAIPDNYPIEWYIQHGLPIPPHLIDQNQMAQNAVNEFESKLGFSSLPWDSTAEWQKFKKWVIATYSGRLTAWEDYSDWRKAKGKYDAMSNKQIRMNPSVFMDTGWPSFLASSAMYDDGEKTRLL